MGAGCLTFILVLNVTSVFIKSKLENPSSFSNVFEVAVLFITFNEVNHIKTLAIHIFVYVPVASVWYFLSVLPALHRGRLYMNLHTEKEADQQNISFIQCLFGKFGISAIDIKRITLVLIPFLIFTIHLYSFAIIFGQYFSVEYICIFIREYTTWTNIFRHSFVKM